MANHKRKRPRSQRAGCKMCKPWKGNGVGKDGELFEKHSDHNRRQAAFHEILDHEMSASIGDESEDDGEFELRRRDFHKRIEEAAKKVAAMHPSERVEIGYKYIPLPNE